MEKFQRNYRLRVQVDKNNFIEITPPYSINFNIERNIFASANTAKIKIYNLNENARNQIYKDIYDTTTYKLVELYAGYGKDKSLLPLIFKGNIKLAYSEHINTENETNIEGYDGGFEYINSRTANSFAAGTPQNDVIAALIKNMPTINIGAIGNFTDASVRGGAFNGSTTDLLNQITGGNFFIDNEKAYCLKENEVIAGGIAVINDSSGLLGTPRREMTYIQIRILFEPRFLVGQMVELKAETDKRFNGEYKVVGFRYNAVISDAVSGQAVTELSLWTGAKKFKQVALFKGN
jgi:hypothetical protein